MVSPDRKHPDSGHKITEGEYQRSQRSIKEAVKPRIGESPSHKLPTVQKDPDELAGGVRLPVSDKLVEKSPPIWSRKKGK